MEYVIDLDSSVVFSPSSIVEEVIQNCRTILGTLLGSVPMERNIGLSWEFVGMPLSVAINKMKVAVTDAFAEQEPRAKITSITFDDIDKLTFAEQGILRPIVKIYIDEEGE